MKNLRTWFIVSALIVAAALSACMAVSGEQISNPTPTVEPPGAPTSTPTEQAPAPTAEPTKESVGGSTEGPTQEPAGGPTEVSGPNELVGTTWTLAAINGGAPVAGTQFTLTFQETDLSGTACNGYGGTYTASGGALVVGGLVHTEMACIDPQGIMDQESAFFDALSGATRYTLSEGQLVLGSEANPSALVFTAGAPEAGGAPEGWLTYQDERYGFALSYPEGGSLASAGDENAARIDLPYTPDTNLQEKYLQIDANSGATECTSPLTEGYAPGAITPEPVTIGGLDWIKESGANAGAGNYYDFTAYSITQGDTCVSLSFVLHSTAAQNYTPPLEEFDREAESAVFEQIVGTFHWLP